MEKSVVVEVVPEIDEGGLSALAEKASQIGRCVEELAELVEELCDMEVELGITIRYSQVRTV